MEYKNGCFASKLSLLGHMTSERQNCLTNGQTCFLKALFETLFGFDRVSFSTPENALNSRIWGAGKGKPAANLGSTLIALASDRIENPRNQKDRSKLDRN